MRKKVLILGSTGFIGSYIDSHLRQFHSEKYKVFTWDKTRHGSLLEKDMFEPYFLDTKPDVIVNCAWLGTSKPEYKNNRQNLDWIESVYGMHELCRKLGIFIVSIGTESENDYQRHDLYVHSKRILHKRLLESGLLTGSCWLQPSYVFSLENLRPELIRTSLKSDVDLKRSIRNPFAENDFIHVLDVVSAIMFIVTNKISGSVSAKSGVKIQNYHLALSVKAKPEKFMFSDSCTTSISHHLSWTQRYTQDLVQVCDYQK